MDRRRLITALTISLLAGAPSAAMASAEKKPADKQVGQYVDLQPVALPMVVDGRLANYIFVSVRLNFASGADISRWRAKEPFFRDALVRAAHRTPFNRPDDAQRIDVARLSASMMGAASAITGPNVIRSVQVTRQVSGRRGRPSHG